ncbi:MAG: TolC family protein [Bacteroidales bacterium]
MRLFVLKSSERLLNHGFRLFILLSIFIFKPSETYSQRVLTLEESINLALENNLGIKMAEEYASATTSIRKASFTKFFPSIDITGNYTRFNKELSLLQDDLLLPVVPVSAIDPTTGEVDPNRLFNPNISPPPTGVVFKPNSSDYYTDSDGNPVFYRYTWIPQEFMTFGQKNTYLLNVGLIQPVFTGGKIKAQYNMSKNFENMFDSKMRLEIAEVVFETKELFLTLLSIQEKRKLAEKYYEMLSALAEDVENIYEEGLILKNDLLKVRVKLNEADLMLLKANNGVKLAAAALKRNIGISIEDSIIVDHELIVSKSFASMEGLVEEALQNRPELDMAKSVVNFSENLVKMAKSRYYPDIAFSANYFFANPNPYNGFANEFGHDYTFGVTMRIPVYDWNEKGHMLSAARHGKKAQELKFEDAISLIELEVTKLYYDLTEAISEVSLRESSLNEAEENLSFAKDSYEEGTITAASMLEAQTIWQEAQSEYIEAKANYQIAAAKLNKALGRMEVAN